MSNNYGTTGKPFYTLEEVNLLDARLQLKDPRIRAYFQIFDKPKTFSDSERNAAMRGYDEWWNESKRLDVITTSFILSGNLNRVLLAAAAHINHIEVLLYKRQSRATQAHKENTEKRIDALVRNSESLDEISSYELKRHSDPTGREQAAYELYRDTLLSIISELVILTDLPFTNIELEKTLVRLWNDPSNANEDNQIEYYRGLLDGPRKVHPRSLLSEKITKDAGKRPRTIPKEKRIVTESMAWPRRFGEKNTKLAIRKHWENVNVLGLSRTAIDEILKKAKSLLNDEKVCMKADALNALQIASRRKRSSFTFKYES